MVISDFFLFFLIIIRLKCTRFVVWDFVPCQNLFENLFPLKSMTVNFRLINVELFFSTVETSREVVAVGTRVQGFVGMNDFVQQLVERLNLLQFTCLFHHRNHVYLSTAPQEPLTHWYQVRFHLHHVTLMDQCKTSVFKMHTIRARAINWPECKADWPGGVLTGTPESDPYQITFRVKTQFFRGLPPLAVLVIGSCEYVKCHLHFCEFIGWLMWHYTTTKLWLLFFKHQLVI